MTRRKVGIALLVGLAALVVVIALVGFTRVRFEPADDAVDIELALDEALEVAVRDGLVDYEALAAFESVPVGTSRGVGIEGIAAALAERGPQSTPSAYPDRSAQLAYYLNAYNVLVLAAVVRFEPSESIHEVHGVIDLVDGFGFFYGLWFEVDGRWTNLYDLEHDRIRAFGDARIHAAINCASASCPALSPTAFRGDTLDAQLDAATRRFVSDESHVRFDSVENTLHLSSIFDWFADDFDAHRDPSGETGLRAFLAEFCEAPSCEVSGDPEVEFMDYDWSLNAL